MELCYTTRVQRFLNVFRAMVIPHVIPHVSQTTFTPPSNRIGQLQLERHSYSLMRWFVSGPLRRPVAEMSLLPRSYDQTSSSISSISLFLLLLVSSPCFFSLFLADMWRHVAQVATCGAGARIVTSAQALCRPLHFASCMYRVFPSYMQSCFQSTPEWAMSMFRAGTFKTDLLFKQKFD